jgi:hypothetical protein
VAKVLAHDRAPDAPRTSGDHHVEGCRWRLPQAHCGSPVRQGEESAQQEAHRTAGCARVRRTCTFESLPPHHSRCTAGICAAGPELRQRSARSFNSKRAASAERARSCSASRVLASIFASQRRILSACGIWNVQNAAAGLSPQNLSHRVLPGRLLQCATTSAKRIDSNDSGHLLAPLHANKSRRMAEEERQCKKTPALRALALVLLQGCRTLMIKDTSLRTIYV